MQSLHEINLSMSDPSRKALTVRLGQDLHAIPIGGVEEVLPALPVEPVPQSPSFVRGVVFVRGHLIPVVDAAERLGIRRESRPDEPHIVCIRVGERIIGVEFDEAIDLIDFSHDAALDASQLGSSGGMFLGVIEHEGQIVRLLDSEQLLTLQESEELDHSI